MVDALRQTINVSRAVYFQERQREKERETQDRERKGVRELQREMERVSDVSETETQRETETETIDPPALCDSSSLSVASLSHRPLSVAEAFHLCTVGSAQVLGLGKYLGNLRPNKKLDCQVIDLNTENSPVDLFSLSSSVSVSLSTSLSEREKDREKERERGKERVKMLFEKYLFTGDDRNVIKVFVNGRCVLQK